MWKSLNVFLKTESFTHARQKSHSTMMSCSLRFVQSTRPAPGCSPLFEQQEALDHKITPFDLKSHRLYSKVYRPLHMTELKKSLFLQCTETPQTVGMGGCALLYRSKPRVLWLILKGIIVFTRIYCSRGRGCKKNFPAPLFLPSHEHDWVASLYHSSLICVLIPNSAVHLGLTHSWHRFITMWGQSLAGDVTDASFFALLWRVGEDEHDQFQHTFANLGIATAFASFT